MNGDGHLRSALLEAQRVLAELRKENEALRQLLKDNAVRLVFTDGEDNKP